MGSHIEINDTLKLTRERGMPAEPTVGERYAFRLPDERLYHRPPTRVFLVEEIDGKWKHIGQGFVWEQTIHSDTHETSGIFEVTTLYDPEYAKMVSNVDSPKGKSFYQ